MKVRILFGIGTSKSSKKPENIKIVSTYNKNCDKYQVPNIFLAPDLTVPKKFADLTSKRGGILDSKPKPTSKNEFGALWQKAGAFFKYVHPIK